MAAEAIGDALQQPGLALLAGQGQELAGGLIHRQHVHAVHPLARHAVGAGALVQLRLGADQADRAAHAVLVVLDQEQDRQVLHGRQVERLVEGADVGGAVAEDAQHRARLLLVVQCQRHPHRDGQVPAHDAPAAQEVAGRVQQVHRAAAPMCDAGLLAEQLGHHRGRVGAARQRHAVVAVAGEHVVVGVGGGQRPDHGGLLADRQVQVAADLGAGVLLLGALLEDADEQHLLVQRE